MARKGLVEELDLLKRTISGEMDRCGREIRETEVGMKRYIATWREYI